MCDINSRRCVRVASVADDTVGVWLVSEGDSGGRGVVARWESAADRPKARGALARSSRLGVPTTEGGGERRRDSEEAGAALRGSAEANSLRAVPSFGPSAGPAAGIIGVSAKRGPRESPPASKSKESSSPSSSWRRVEALADAKGNVDSLPKNLEPDISRG
jgi:hypothetical protein